MSDLRFRCLVDNDFCDIAPFEPYIEKGSSDMGLALIAFDESELDTIKSLLNETQLEGSDGYLYTKAFASVFVCCPCGCVASPFGLLTQRISSSS